MSGDEALLKWVQAALEGADDVEISSFNEGWADGRALCAIISHFKPELVSMKDVGDDAEENLDLAFNTAEELGIPALLDTDDVDEWSKDEDAITTYVKQLYHFFRKDADASDDDNDDNVSVKSEEAPEEKAESVGGDDDNDDKAGSVSGGDDAVSAGAQSDAGGDDGAASPAGSGDAASAGAASADAASEGAASADAASVHSKSDAGDDDAASDGPASAPVSDGGVSEGAASSASSAAAPAPAAAAAYESEGEVNYDEFDVPETIDVPDDENEWIIKIRAERQRREEAREARLAQEADAADQRAADKAAREQDELATVDDKVAEAAEANRPVSALVAVCRSYEFLSPAWKAARAAMHDHVASNYDN